MTNSGAVELERKYLQNPPNEEEEEADTSDDSEVSVANMNRHASKEVLAEEDNDEEYSGPNVEAGNDTLSDDEYTYSEDSLCSDDTCGDSEITNVTPTSSPSAGHPTNRTMSLEFPGTRRQFEEIPRTGSTPPHETVHNARENIRRMCSSANDNRYSIANEHHTDTTVHPRARRRNMSFTNAEMRKIDLENQYLLKKIMAQQKPLNKPMRVQSAQPRLSSSAINRRKLQKKIEEENMVRQ